MLFYPAALHTVRTTKALLLITSLSRFSLLCVITTYNTVFHVEMTKNQALNITEIMHLLQDNGQANTGLTFIW